MRVVDGAVVAIEVVEAALRIDGARMVERHRVADMIEQELGIAKVGHAVWSPIASTQRTAERGDEGSPLRSVCGIPSRLLDTDAQLPGAAAAADGSRTAR